MTAKQPNGNGIRLLERARGAFLGAAIGDALGWPNENRSNRVGRRNSSPAMKTFQRWVRRPGGRFLPHEDVILPGEYSDDTQLLLCTARSLLYGSLWWKRLANCEFPLWKLYERGAGGASKRAADAWLLGKEPWSHDLKSAERRRYFDAGGNGVAMRIMPHALLGAHSLDFQVTARDIVANGLVSHGHPRALVGSLAYGYALWRAFQQHDTLEYGALIDITIDGQESWSHLPAFNEICPDWLKAAHEASSNRYESHWVSTVNELISLLQISKDAIKQGALAIDREALAKFGCFDPNISSAGTVTATAAIFLASRYAADPIHGIFEAASASGADTDTLASMTGALLGAVCGYEWLGEYSEEVQDAKYLNAIADQFTQPITSSKESDTTDVVSVKKADLNAVISTLVQSKEGDFIKLPDNRDANISSAQKHVSASKLDVISWKLSITDRQTFYVKRISRKMQHPQATETKRSISSTQIEVPSVNSRVKLPVASFDRSKVFYRDVIGLKIKVDSSSKVYLEGAIELVPLTYVTTFSDPREASERDKVKWRTIVLLEIRALDQTYRRIQESGATIQTPMTEKSGRRFFRCLDPDDNIVEILESH